MDGHSTVNAIDVHNLSLKLDDAVILQDVSFAIPQNSFTAIIGPNGAGKSTLLKCLAMLHSHWMGDITIQSRPARAYSHRELARAIAYVPQQTATLPPFTITDFMAMSQYAWDKENTTAINDALERTGLSHMKERRIDTLSGGETQKLFIAAALAQNAPIILLDEPTAFLDPKYQREIRTLLAQLKQDGLTIIAVSHNINAAIACADTVIALKHGKLLYNQPPAEIMTQEALAALYDTTFTFTTHPTTGAPIIVE